MEKSVVFKDGNGTTVDDSEFLSGSIPTTVIIDKEGKVVGHLEGGADYMHPEIVQFLNQ